MRADQKNKVIAKDKPLTIVFVRHAQANPNDGTLELGPVLSNLGERQAERLARRLSEETFNHIYSSDLTRAWQTTQFILKYQNHLTWTVSSDIREVSHHHFAPGRIPLTLSMRKNLREERMSLERFVAQIRRTHVPPEKILIVCHGNVIRSIVPLFASRRPEKVLMMDISNTAITMLEVWSSGEAILKLANCVRHLIPKQVT
jgi:broad specificity phosphatase PhoE